MHTSPTSPSLTFSTRLERADRWLVLIAYLGLFVGLWLIAPIAVYLLARRRSRFVAHHAALAALMHLLFGPLLGLCGLVGSLLGVGLALVLGGAGVTPHVLALVSWASVLAPFAAMVGYTALAAWRAWHGRLDPTTRLARAAAWLLAHDRELAPPA